LCTLHGLAVFDKSLLIEAGIEIENCLRDSLAAQGMLRDKVGRMPTAGQNQGAAKGIPE
jgi:hypothetical protein